MLTTISLKSVVKWIVAQSRVRVKPLTRLSFVPLVIQGTGTPIHPRMGLANFFRDDVFRQHSDWVEMANQG